MEPYEMLPKEILDNVCLQIHEAIQMVEDGTQKATIIARLEGTYNAIQTERCQCNVVPVKRGE